MAIPDQLTAIVAIVALAGLTQGLSGFGSALVAVPLLALVLPMATLVPLVILLGTLVSLVNLLHLHQAVAGAPIMRLLLWSTPALLRGTLAGIWLYRRLGEHDYWRILLVMVLGHGAGRGADAAGSGHGHRLMPASLGLLASAQPTRLQVLGNVQAPLDPLQPVGESVEPDRLLRQEHVQIGHVPFQPAETELDFTHVLARLALGVQHALEHLLNQV
jgi:hypothetical protein